MIIACDEEEKIRDAVRSVGWADEVVVVDSGSTDRTREIAEELGAWGSENGGRACVSAILNPQ